MDIGEFLKDVSGDREMGPEIVHLEKIPPREARFAAMPAGLHPSLVRGLAALGIDRLYAHQVEAITRSLAGEDLVVVTPTASGKTLCFNIPVLQGCLEEPTARALYLFPIKALEQDQLGALLGLAEASGMGESFSAGIYDGDTPASAREKMRRSPPRVVVSNPDMVHLSMLAHHPKWEELFRNLSYLVLDEVHTYRGVFGSHVAHLLRRLLRVAAAYGSHPRIIACSATIANPGEHASRLTGRPVAVIGESGAPESGRTFLFVNPRCLSASTIASRLLARAVRAGLATIVFTKARKMTELIHTWTTRSEPRLRHLISAYRAGYLPGERREIEQALFSGRLRGVISTSALEMGVDIGSLDVCVLVGYPGAVTTTWQRGGRVGRQERESLIILVAQPDALDQYFMKHPRVFFDAGFEPAVIDPGNRPIRKGHLVCAAAEIPLARNDPWFFPGGAESSADDPAVVELEQEGALLRAVGEDAWHSTRLRPHRDLSIRGMGESFTIFAMRDGDAPDAKPRAIGSLDGHRALSEGHPGAIYLHRGQSFEMVSLDLEKRNIRARAAEADYYTVPLREKETAILAVRRSALVRNFIARLGELRVTERVTGYEKKRLGSGERLSVHELELPSTTFETVGLWLEMDDFIPRVVLGRGENFMGGIHAVEHAAIALFPLFALCERDDVGGISIPRHPDLGKAAIFIYDGYPGGVGLAEQSFARLTELLERTLELISSCDCEKGCPSCIYSNKCGNGNVPLDKWGAVTILSLLLDRPESRQWLAAAGSTPGEQPDTEPAGEPVPPSKPAGPRVVVMDVETRRAAAEVGGWGNIHLMGLAIAVTWDSLTGESRAWREEEAREMIHFMAGADLVVGFNIVGFDYRVLSAYDDGTIARIPTFDMLADLRKRLGFRISLGHLGEENLGRAKTADGLQSLEWVRQGRLDLVEEYCREDVALTRDFFQHVLREKRVRFRNRDGRLMELCVDWDLDALAAAAR
jgi:DEAD/DEAH box helicase domain-containing protein